MSDEQDPDGPELYMIDFSALPGAEYREQRQRARDESRRRYRQYLAAELDASGVPDDVDDLAVLVLDTLTVWNDVESDGACRCSCHPTLPESDFHDFGFSCSCSRTAEDRRRSWDDWLVQQEEYWDSPDGQRVKARQAADDAELRAAIDADPGVVVASHGGLAPEQWKGQIDGHSFFFRERHDHWRIEIDLRPSGRFTKVWMGGDPEDETNLQDRELEEGDDIASGDTRVDGYGTTPAERLRFIVETVRAHLRRQECQVHRGDRDDLELLLGGPLRYCPDCGAQL